MRRAAVTGFEKERIRPQTSVHKSAFAYSPWNKWVFRGSFGILYVPRKSHTSAVCRTALAAWVQGTNTANAPFKLEQGVPRGIPPGRKTFGIRPCFRGQAVRSHTALLAGYSDAFNIGAQYEVDAYMRESGGLRRQSRA